MPLILGTVKSHWREGEDRHVTSGFCICKISLRWQDVSQAFKDLNVRSGTRAGQAETSRDKNKETAEL